MLRIAILSLLLGAGALIVGLTQFFPPLNASQQEADALVWNAATAKVTTGTPTFIDSALQLELDGTGAGLITLNEGTFLAKDFSFIHIALEQAERNLLVTIIWTNAQNPQDSQSYTVESDARQALWLATDELRGWGGEIDTLSLSFSGRAGDTVLISDFSLYPASATRQLLAIYSDLLGYAPWNTAAMNTHTGAFNSASFYPVALAVALLALSLLAYALLIVIFRARLHFNPAVVVLLFFASWFILDMFWQQRLLHQLVDTYHIFAGKSTEEKLAVGPDAKLYSLAAHAKPLMEPTHSRIFVVSSDVYSGMRTAYYFFPHNVYWRQGAPVLPANNLLREGDYIVMVKPSPFTFDQDRSLVVAPQIADLSAEHIFSDQTGTVVRLK